MCESWRPVVGYEDAYEVSDHGRVRSRDRAVALTCPRRGSYTMRLPGRLRRNVPDRNGHVHVILYDEGRGRQFAVHILVLEAFVGPAPAGHYAAPLDDDLANCALSNLVWRSYAEGDRLRAERGTKAVGGRDGFSKLSEADVSAIRSSTGAFHRSLADRYGIGISQVRKIRARECWGHVP